MYLSSLPQGVSSAGGYVGSQADDDGDGDDDDNDDDDDK